MCTVHTSPTVIPFRKKSMKLRCFICECVCVFVCLLYCLFDYCFLFFVFFLFDYLFVLFCFCLLFCCFLGERVESTSFAHNSPLQCEMLPNCIQSYTKKKKQTSDLFSRLLKKILIQF